MLNGFMTETSNAILNHDRKVQSENRENSCVSDSIRSRKRDGSSLQRLRRRQGRAFGCAIG